MSTISANPFALLGGGDSDDEAGGTTNSIPLKSNKATPVSVAPTVKKTIPGQQVKRDRGDYPTRGAPRKVYGGQSGGNNNNEAEVVGSKPAGFTDTGRDDRAERRGGGGGRGRGGRGGRGGGGGRGRGGGRFDDRPDRHSTTGIHDTDRKVASGWGAEEGKKELQAENEGWGDAKADLAPPAEGEEGWGGANAGEADTSAPANGHTEAKPEPREEEEEDKTKTLEEYLAEKANAISNLPGAKQNIRKPNEGADDSQWKGAIKLVKGQEEEEVFFQVNKEKKAPQASNKKTKEKTFIEVEPLGYRPPRSGGDRGRGRGGRGRGDRDGGERRGGRGRGGRGGHGAGSRELNTEDASAFPSLS